MTDTSRAETILKEHRKSIDRLDSILVYTLAERFKQTQAVGLLKAEHSLFHHLTQSEKLNKLND